MDNEPQVIRDQMQETRTALTEKLDTLQQKVATTVESITTPVAETVQTVKEAVSDTVGTVQETVAGTVETVKDTFNVSRHVQEHPWPVMLGSVAAGFLLGRLLPSPRQAVRYVGAASDTVTAGMSQASHLAQPAARKQEEPASESNGLFGGLGNALKGEMDKLTGLGVSVGVGLLRDLMTTSLQGEVGDRVREWVDGVTQQLGGKPLKEPLVQPEERSPDPEPVRPSAKAKEKGGLEPARRW